MTAFRTWPRDMLVGGFIGVALRPLSFGDWQFWAAFLMLCTAYTLAKELADGRFAEGEQCLRF